MICQRISMWMAFFYCTVVIVNGQPTLFEREKRVENESPFENNFNWVGRIPRLEPFVGVDNAHPPNLILDSASNQRVLLNGIDLVAWMEKVHNCHTEVRDMRQAYNNHFATDTPTIAPTASPHTSEPTTPPTKTPTASPMTSEPTPSPTPTPVTSNPTPSPSPSPTTWNPTPAPTPSPFTSKPTPYPSPTPTTTPSLAPPCPDTSEEHFKAYPSRRFFNNEEHKEVADNVETCARGCEQDEACLGFNYKASASKCEYKIKPMRAALLSENDDWVFFDRVVFECTPQVAYAIPISITYEGSTFSGGETFTIVGGQRAVQTITVEGRGVVEVEAAGSVSGRGKWNRNNNRGAPGGTIKIRTIFDYDSPTTLFAFVGEQGAEVDSSAGAGGASTDLRTKYEGSLTDVSNAIFLTDFTEHSSLASRIIVGGGGGGSHGGVFGYYDTTNHPGCGGPDRTTTNCFSDHDGGHTDCGANAHTFGVDAGSSVDARYTGNGSFGCGGQSSDNSHYGVYTSGAVGGVFKSTGMTWPNGGSGTGWANGGGGGGWYGGAGNWPNGGGGSNFATEGEVLLNEGCSNDAVGHLKITILKSIAKITTTNQPSTTNQPTTSIQPTSTNQPSTTDQPSTTEQPTNTPGPDEERGPSKFKGYAAWTQDCVAEQTDDFQDNLMHTTCNNVYPGSHAASYIEFLSGLIDNAPTDNDSDNYVIFTLPEPEECSTHRTHDNVCFPRNCVQPSGAFPTQCGESAGWTTHCHTTERKAMCVMPLP